jgi:hypothetical protein
MNKFRQNNWIIFLFQVNAYTCILHTIQYLVWLICFFSYGLSWNPNLNGHLLSASDDHVSIM